MSTYNNYEVLDDFLHCIVVFELQADAVNFCNSRPDAVFIRELKFNAKTKSLIDEKIIYQKN